MRSVSKGVFAAVCAAGLAILVHTSASAQPIKDRVMQEGRIVIGIHNQPPWGFKNANGELTGYHPDIVRAVLGPAGVSKVEFVSVEWGALIPSLQAKRIDAVASGMVITRPRCEQVIFSDPDLAIVDGVLVKRGNPLNVHSYADVASNPKIQLASLRGSSETENALKSGVPRAQLQQYPSVDSIVTALLSGRVDAATFTSGTAIAVLNDTNVKGLERAAPFNGLVENGREVATYAAIEFRPEDTALRDLYNENLKKRVADGTLDKIRAKYGFGPSEAVPKGVTAQDLCKDKYR